MINFNNYLYLGFFVFLALIICLLLYIVSYLFSYKINNFYKLLDYECGFMSYTESKITFDIQFFIVGLLFIIFDLEIIFLIPWAINLGSLSFFGFFSMFIFLFLLIIGFIYEWKKGALSWSIKQ